MLQVGHHSIPEAIHLEMSMNSVGKLAIEYCAKDMQFAIFRATQTSSLTMRKFP